MGESVMRLWLPAGEEHAGGQRAALGAHYNQSSRTTRERYRLGLRRRNLEAIQSPIIPDPNVPSTRHTTAGTGMPIARPKATAKAVSNTTYQSPIASRALMALSRRSSLPGSKSFSCSGNRFTPSLSDPGGRGTFEAKRIYIPNWVVDHIDVPVLTLGVGCHSRPRIPRDEPPDARIIVPRAQVVQALRCACLGVELLVGEEHAGGQCAGRAAHLPEGVVALPMIEPV